jgi:hypothetical protein
MKIAWCDFSHFETFRKLVEGPFTPADVGPAERFVRTVVLHDEIKMMPSGMQLYEDESGQRFERMSPIFPDVTRFIVFAEKETFSPSPFLPDADGIRRITLDGVTLANMFGMLEKGGSILTGSGEIETKLAACEAYPDRLFEHLDTKWQDYAKKGQLDGFGLLIPPILGVVLTRCARRNAIPTVLADLRNEWARPRRTLWAHLDALKESRTLAEAEKIRESLSKVSKHLSLETSEFDTKPIRVFWEIAATASAGAAIGAISGGSPYRGALAGGMGAAARSMPSLLHEFGPVLFGRGAFDMAQRVRTEISKVELDALSTLLGNSERQHFI